jgi:hypothetical protein
MNFLCTKSSLRVIHIRYIPPLESAGMTPSVNIVYFLLWKGQLLGSYIPSLVLVATKLEVIFFEPNEVAQICREEKVPRVVISFVERLMTGRTQSHSVLDGLDIQIRDPRLELFMIAHH